MTENTPVDNGLDESIAEIELLCEQREFERAASIGQDLLRTHPTSPRLHEVMGDVAAARGDAEDAVRWYELSLQLEHSDSVMNKLARQRGLMQWRRTQRERQQAEEAPEEVDERRHYKIIAGVAAGVVVVILGIFLIIGMGRWVSSPAPQAPRTTRSAPVRPGTASRITPPSGPTTTARPNLPAPRTTPTAPSRDSYTRTPQRVSPQPDNSNLPPVQITRAISAPLTSRDERLVKTIGKLKWPSGASLSGDVNVMFDPYTGYTFITVELPRSLSASQGYQAVVKQGYAVAQTAIRSDPGVRNITIRFIAKVTIGDETPVVTIYRGNTTRDMLSHYEKTTSSPHVQDIRERVFAATWWNPAVPGGKN